jgi:hypothetical protein
MMAKLTLAQRVAQAEAVRRVRDRYAEALRMGHPPLDAAKLAQGNGSITQPVGRKAIKVTAPASSTRPPVKISNEPKTDRVSISGSAAAAPAAEVEEKSPTQVVTPTTHDIPPNWEDLPWPQLRELASGIAGKPVRSRIDAAKVIEEALNS